MITRRVQATHTRSATGVPAGPLPEHGYASVVAPEPAAPDYQTVLASRGAPPTPVPSGIGVLPHRAPAATVLVGDELATLLGLYMSSRGPRERRNEAKRAFHGAVSEALPGFVSSFDEPVIAAGDLNVVEPGHVRTMPSTGTGSTTSTARSRAPGSRTPSVSRPHPNGSSAAARDTGSITPSSAPRTAARCDGAATTTGRRNWA